MRIALSGKGGSGKTTIAATLARTFGRLGHVVNALDDDPNPNLAAALGLAGDQLARLRRPPMKDILEECVDGDGQRFLRLVQPFEAVLEEYGARGPDNVRVLMMTGLVGAGKG